MSQDFLPDSKHVSRVVASENHEARRAGLAPGLVVLHYTGMESAEAALARLCDSRGSERVSAHYFVGEDGTILQLVPEAQRAWHAGEGSWAGAGDINSRSIGVEIVNPGHDYGYPDFSAAQIDAVIALLRDVAARRAIRADCVLAHSDVAPARKRDPGEKFPWQRLHSAGVGHWVEPEPLADGPILRTGDKGGAVRMLQEELARYGYGLMPTGVYDPQTRSVVEAFQRHFRPARVDGNADPSTRATLRRLLDSRPISAT